ncbi:hypothetical protein [Psychrobacter sp. CAL346-MNA-CIBAN-0220]|uniref:hypothetical protein n=1 Tax=Psychrobacter sp. CAL346-MNA-CIBAN-0220 TaxID=3140457 RepID=UPI00332B0AC5
MDLENQEKLLVTNRDELRRRHKGNYKAVTNGEIYLLPYEVSLRSKSDSFFSSLSNYDFLKNTDNDGQLTLTGLRQELWVLDDENSNNDFWKNFNDSALKTHLNTILGLTRSNKKDKDWRQTYLKQAKETDIDKPHHDDMLKCIYLLAHMHKASPTFIRQLAVVNDAWSTDLRVYYPRKDFAFSEEYGGYLAELYSNILYHQSDEICKVLKSFDLLIDKMVKLSGVMFADILERRSKDNDSPSLKILKYNQISSITHHQALQRYLISKITADFYDDSFDSLKNRENQGLANVRHYWLVAAQCLRLKLGNPMTKKGDYWYSDGNQSISQQDVDYLISLHANALAADALQDLKFESPGSKSGKKDTSLPAAIRKMAEQNPQTVDEILEAPVLDVANIPEVYTKYMLCRTQYAEFYRKQRHLEFIENMKPNPKVEKVLSYIKGNNLAQIHADVDEIERKVKLMNILQGNIDNIEGVTIVFEYGMHELPKRE